MTLRTLSACIVAMLLLAPTTALPTERAPKPPEAVGLQAELEKAASRLRGLKFKHTVDYEVVERSAIQDLLNARLSEEFPPGKLENASAAYAKLGLIEPGVNLKDAVLALYGEQLAAFYDQKKKKLYSVEGLPFSEEFQKVLMVHELTHVLQDQNFDLSTLPLDCKDNDDRALAALSLVEGDATLVFSQYASQYVKVGLKDVLASMTTGQKGLLEAPYVLRQNLLFPYSKGTPFVTRLFQKGGWELVNKAFENPPQSTEQILHPEKYSDPRDEPVPVSLPDFSSLGGRKWDLLEDNVLGELNTRILFTEFLGSIRSIRPSRGWGGDRFRVYRVQKGKDTLLVWATAWDTPKDREEFVSYYRKALARKYEGKEFTTVEGKDSVCLTSPDLVLWLGWRETTALVLEAPNNATLLDVLWEFLKSGGGPRFTAGTPTPESPGK